MRIIVALFLSLAPIISCYAGDGAQWKVINETPYMDGVAASRKYFKREFDNGATDLIEVVQSLTIKEGELRTIRKQWDDGNWQPSINTLLLGNREIFISKQDSLVIYGAYPVRGKTYVLIGEKCGGTGCRIYDLSFLALNNEQLPIVIAAKDFFSETNSIKVAVENNRIVIDLGISKQSEKIATLENENISVNFIRASYRPLTKQQCSDLFQLVKGCSELQTLYKKDVCNSMAVGYSPGYSSGMWLMRELKNQPGFNQEAFDKFCLKACLTKALSKQEEFESDVCRSNG